MFARSLKTTITAGLLATTLAFTAVAPNSAAARMSDDEIAGLLGLLVIGAAIHSSRNNDRTSEPAPTINRSDRNERHDRGVRNWQVLPAQCLTTAQTRRGATVRMFGQRCLNNNYQFTNRLPQDCRVNFRGERGAHRQGYDVACMRNAGFRTNRH
ncbi:hypothetical protein SAMN05444287_2745 [Octadecabacter temperatus]|uniref:Uncharacterized protein n=1 Tax=Octadecabacter temperatus TaxID=1458307 RepID=A0A0K0Y9L5_9RHOB|nr:hypothetical protein [Octadecabacter temperatus]AKS47601.1 hypothetical protein OSB_30850 [Octadecabacter temperatus]SIO40773.1 hypothetical protein SAMN05444287_2745 [Octadecabacter temperatus]